VTAEGSVPSPPGAPVRGDAIVLRAVTVAYVLSLLVGTLYPFEFAEPQRVFDLRHRTPYHDPDHGLRFEGSGLVATREPLRGLRTAIADAGGIDLLIELRADEPHRPGPRRVFGLEAPRTRIGLSVNQRGHDLLLRTTGPGRSLTESGFDDLFVPGTWQRLTVAHRLDSLEVRVDSALVGRAAAPLAPDRWPEGLRAVVGNGADGTAGWRGTVRALALTLPGVDTPVATLDPGRVPGDAWIATKRDLAGNHADDPWSLVPFSEPARMRWARADWAQNLAMFVPLGMMLWGIGFRWPWILLSGFALSFSIETAQVFIPTRHAQMSDVVLNAAGGPLGAVLVAGLARLFGRRP